jgi:hypothetical protein
MRNHSHRPIRFVERRKIATDMPRAGSVAIFDALYGSHRGKERNADSSRAATEEIERATLRNGAQ